MILFCFTICINSTNLFNIFIKSLITVILCEFKRYLLMFSYQQKRLKKNKKDED